MFDRKLVEALAAQSLHEDLSARDQATLDEGLKKYPDIAALHGDMQNILPQLPDNPPELEEDLLQRVRAGLETTSVTQSRGNIVRMATLAAAAAVAIGVFSYALLPQTPMESEGIVTSESSPVHLALLDFRRAVEDGESVSAYTTLKTIVTENADDPHAATAQLALSDLAFDELNRFADAHADYAAYRSNFQTDFNLHPRRNEILRRSEMLEETASENYRPLELLAQAKLRGIDAMPELESLLASHAARFVGEEAAFTMAAVVGDEELLEGEAMRDALAAAREACTQPIAQDQIDLVLGMYTADVLEDRAGSTVYLERAGASDDARVARAARERLEQWN